jgi:hypothetical protein
MALPGYDCLPLQTLSAKPHILVLCLRQENYAKEAIFAVLSEWFRTPETLPLILRQAVQMGLFSSQQLVRFLALDNRPTVTRAVQRSLPTSVSRLARADLRMCLGETCMPA